MGIPPGVPVKAAKSKSIGPCPLLSRGLSRHTTASTPSGGMPGRAGGVAPGGRTAAHTESTLYLRRTCSGRQMAQTGHEERFPSTRLSAGYGFRKETIAGVRHNGRDAPKPVLSETALGAISGFQR